MKRILLTIAIVFFCCLALDAQPKQEFVRLCVAPDHEDWTYDCGQQAKVTFYAVCQNELLKDVEIEYNYGPDNLDPVFKGKVKLDSKGFATIKVPGAVQPGFVNVKANLTYEGHRYSGRTNLAFEPDKLRPTVTLPDDFTSYWEDAKSKAAKVPMLTRVRFCEEQSDDRVDVFYVRIQAVRPGTYVYGVLTVPKTPGPKPAILRLPGAAVRAFNGPCELAYEGFVCLEIGVHGIPVDQDPEIYRAVSANGMSDYVTKGIDNRDTYYYRRTYLSLVRAIDYLCSREDVDPARIAAYGGSQGGMLSIVAAGLDKRISALFAYFPAFCDVCGYYNGRAGGWPHLFRNPKQQGIDAKLNTLRYFDTANFARFVEVPGIYAFGYNDNVCCPTSTTSAYNVIPGPKQLLLARDTGHWLYPWQTEAALNWLKVQFGM